MQQQIFTDGIGKISVIGGVVRLDFMVYAPTDADTPGIPGQPRQLLTHQVLMGVEAFARASAQCAEAAKQLQAQPAAAPVPKQVAPKPQAPTPVAAAPMTSSVETTPAPRPANASPWTANLKPVAPMRPFP